MAKTGDHYTQRGGSIKSFEQGKKKYFESVLTPNDLGGGALCVQMGFYEDIFWESRCNIEINV